MKLLDRYVGLQFLRIFGVCVLGVPFLLIVIDLTDNIDRFIDQGATRGQVALHYLYQLPYQSLLAFPIAALLSSVFTVSSMTKRFETTAIKAGGISFYRMTVPLLLLATLLSGVALVLTDIVPVTNRRSVQILEPEESRSETLRMTFVYRANQGLVYKVRRLDTRERRMDNIQVEREGSGLEYPTVNITANTASWDSVAARWALNFGWLRKFPTHETEHAYRFQQLYVAGFDERPEELLAKPKEDVDEMRFGEILQEIEAVERAGGTPLALQMSRAQRIAFPITCLVIVVFGIPLAHSNRRGGAPLSIGIALATTVVYLTIQRIAEGLGAGGALPADAAAWIPNGLFLVAGLVLYARVRT